MLTLAVPLFIVNCHKPSTDDDMKTISMQLRELVRKCIYFYRADKLRSLVEISFREDAGRKQEEFKRGRGEED